jgi:ferrochelatase
MTHKIKNHTAIILIALGGPRSLDDVGPFMAAFMGRPAPQPVVNAVVERYKLIGGKSPLPELVKAQADVLEKELGTEFRAYAGFRYSHPMVAESFDRAIEDGARRVVALSMSPFSTEVTTGAYKSVCDGLGNGETCPLFIPSWHDNQLFIDSWVDKIMDGIARFESADHESVMNIFTSHSIPIRYIESGDPYRHQIEETVRLVVEKTGIKNWRVAWQSKGTQATEPWLGPEVEPTLDLVSQQGFKRVLEIPIGFTCDHMETLYDIDIVHRAYAKNLGVKFERTDSLNTSPLFIKALADVVKNALRYVTDKRGRIHE